MLCSWVIQFIYSLLLFFSWKKACYFGHEFMAAWYIYQLVIQNEASKVAQVEHMFLYSEWFNLVALPWQVGVTVAACKYDLNAAAPFQTSDILDLQPVVKHSVPVCSEAKDLVETGKVQLAEVCTVLRCLTNKSYMIGTAQLFLN